MNYGFSRRFSHSLALMVVDHSSSNNHLPFNNGSAGNFNNKSAYITDAYHTINSSHSSMNNPNSSYVNENGIFANGAMAQQVNGAAANGANQMRPGKTRKRPANGSAKSDTVRDADVAKDSSDEIKDKTESGKQPDEKKPKEEPISPVLKSAGGGDTAVTDKKDSADTSAKEASAPKSTSEQLTGDEQAQKSAASAEDNQTSTSENLYVASDMRSSDSPKISLVKLLNNDGESSKTDEQKAVESASDSVTKEPESSKANP